MGEDMKCQAAKIDFSPKGIDGNTWKINHTPKIIIKHGNPELHVSDRLQNRYGTL